MTGLHRELAHYLIEAIRNEKLSKKPKVLIIGKDAELLRDVLSDEGLEINAFNILRFIQYSPLEDYDAILVNDNFNELQFPEVEQLLNQTLKTLRVGGLAEIRLHLRDSRWNLAQYTNLFDCYRFNIAGHKNSIGFEMLWEQGLRDTIFTHHDWHDHCWLLKKAEFETISADKQAMSVRDYLDRYQYTDHGIKKYEWIFGHGFISPGGEAQNGEFLSQLRLKPGEIVLDIGCGIGGNAFQIAKYYGAQVIGVDLSSNAVAIACDRASLKQDTRVRFLIADITTMHFPPNTFDVVYSRDCILHIPDKHSLFENIFTWLKPGGRVLITDYMQSGAKDQTTHFQQYVTDRQYTLWSLQQYVRSAEKAAFNYVDGKDITEQFKRVIEMEMKRAEENKAEFLQQFSEDEYEHLIKGWNNKLGYIADGDLKWGMLKAIKT